LDENVFQCPEVAQLHADESAARDALESYFDDILVGRGQHHCPFWHISIVFERVLSFVEGYN